MKEIVAEDGGRPLLNDDLLLLQAELGETIAAQVRAFGQNMVVSGCDITQAATAGNSNVSPGVVFLDGRFLRTEALADVTLPVFLIAAPPVDTSRTYKTGTAKPAVRDYTAQMVAAQPQAGSYITLNAARSQYYAAILRNGIMPVGSILEIDEDNIGFFDTNTLLGSGPWTGWSLLQKSFGRFSVGYDPGSSATPETNPGLVRNYAKVGNTGGSDTVSLTADQNGPHSHALNAEVIASGTPANANVRTDSSSYRRVSPSTQVGTSGQGSPHENRPAYVVLAKVKKIA
jgi:hypothetical protein